MLFQDKNIEYWLWDSSDLMHHLYLESELAHMD